MGDDNAGEVTPLSVSAYFDETHKKYLSLVRGEEETGSQSVQVRVIEEITCIKGCIKLMVEF